MTNLLPKPIQVREALLEDLPPHYLEAAENATDMLQICGQVPVRIETFHTHDIRILVEQIWQWPCTLQDLNKEHHQYDRIRVQYIMKLLNENAPRWPYVSYWADDMEELAETHTDQGEVEVFNHGDGWHRIIATVELKLPTIEIMFL